MFHIDCMIGITLLCYDFLRSEYVCQIFNTNQCYYNLYHLYFPVIHCHGNEPFQKVIYPVAAAITIINKQGHIKRTKSSMQPVKT